jgi:ubiquinone/menaquinone biosynthesis C-methylase UbiE
MKKMERDFDRPSFWFTAEDKLKNLLRGTYYGKDVKVLNLKGDESVLDFGCGGGTASRHIMDFLTERGRLLGVDTSAYWIKIASRRLEKYPNANFQAGDIRTMDLPGGSMDVIVTLHVLHHIEPAARLSVVQELARLLKKDGRFYIRERIEASHGIPADELRSLLSRIGFREAYHSLTKAEYRGLFTVENKASPNAGRH